jgi:hypothetical protein
LGLERLEKKLIQRRHLDDGQICSSPVRRTEILVFLRAFKIGQRIAFEDLPAGQAAFSITEGDENAKRSFVG